MKTRSEGVVCKQSSVSKQVYGGHILNILYRILVKDDIELPSVNSILDRKKIIERNKRSAEVLSSNDNSIYSRYSTQIRQNSLINITVQSNVLIIQ